MTAPNHQRLLSELISLLNEEKLIRLQGRAEKKGYEELAKLLKERRKALEHEEQ